MTKLAPRRFVGQMMGMWFMCTALGNALAGVIAGTFDAGALVGVAMAIRADRAHDRGRRA